MTAANNTAPARPTTTPTTAIAATSGLSPTATYVLTYSLALKNLCITGKDANPANVLSQAGGGGGHRLRVASIWTACK